MRMSNLLAPTLREAPADAGTAGRALLARGGFLHRLGPGRWAHLPPMRRVTGAIAALFAREAERGGGQAMPLPATVRGTAELLRGVVRSYRQLPLVLYQADPDVVRIDVVGPRSTFAGPWHHVLPACGVAAPRLVDAGRGRAVLAGEEGDAATLRCDACGAEAIAALADAAFTPHDGGAPRDRRVVETPGTKTIEALCALLGCAPQAVAKTLLYVADDRPVAAVIRGDLAVNEARLADHLAAASLRMATEAEVRAIAGVPPGFVGPAGLAVDRLVADRSLAGATNLVMATNAPDVHAVDVNDWAPAEWADLRRASAGEPCAACGAGRLAARRGLLLGTHTPADATAAAFTGPDGQDVPLTLARWTFDPARIAEAAAAARLDAPGQAWPWAIAPFLLAIVPINVADDAVREAGEALYDEARAAGIPVVLDDRDERAGVKFKDGELLGFPLRLTVGKAVADGEVELVVRATGEKRMVQVRSAISAVQALVPAGII